MCVGNGIAFCCGGIAKECAAQIRPLFAEIPPPVGQPVPQIRLLPLLDKAIFPEESLMPEHQPEHMILLLSDLQSGLRTDTFNADEFVRRFERLTAAVLRLKEIHETDRKIPKLWVAAAGDFVEGEPYTRRINLAELDCDELHRPLDVLAQKRLVQETVLGGLEQWADRFEEVEFLGVMGNHGAGRGKDASKRSNDDTEVYLNIADRCQKSNVAFRIEQSKFYQVFVVQGHPFLLVHGHQVKMWSRTPLYGIINMTTLWHQVLPEPFEYVLMGHFHSLNRISAVGTPVFLNGAFCSDDEWGMSKGLKADAGQWVLGVHPRRGVAWFREIWLV